MKQTITTVGEILLWIAIIGFGIMTVVVLIFTIFVL